MRGCPLEVFMMDKFGDGWNGAKLTVAGGPKERTFSPGPYGSGLTVNVALSPLEESKIYVTSSSKGDPKEFWEVWWSFSVDDIPYVGGYETEITLMCLWQSPTDYVIQVVEVKNVPELTCSRCTKPKPKPKPSKIVKMSEGKDTLLWAGSNGETLSLVMTQQEMDAYTQTRPILTYQDAVQAAEFEAQIVDITDVSDLNEEDENPFLATESTDGTMVSDLVSGVINVRRGLDLDGKPKPQPKPKPAPKKYPYAAMLLNTDGNGWFDGTGVSTYYSISTIDRYHLVTSGTMCGSDSQQICEESLPDGEFILRVGGNGDPNRDDNTWEFCGVMGGSQTELVFSVAKGKCKVTSDLISLSDIKKSKKYSGTDDDEVNVTDDDTSILKDSSSSPWALSNNDGVAALMLAASAGIGSFIIGFIAVNAIVMYSVQKSNLRKQQAIINTELTNEKLLAANGLTIIKENDINSSRHKLVSSLDL
eukprot:CAMPEP_0182416774 /NCGR_PEP_ID=MMETSP1167-20130531/1127_1 /TAXON_ID=2988 /ORGANISM="Mallomonas Sp, Strain CCMP3275" /LENGTH=475 /DNA_ID=CAMNT_0024589827 /DNA_START=211 /DNA_END=1638 /DNA_ORIENTATION=+